MPISRLQRNTIHVLTDKQHVQKTGETLFMKYNTIQEVVVSKSVAQVIKQYGNSMFQKPSANNLLIACTCLRKHSLHFFMNDNSSLPTKSKVKAYVERKHYIPFIM